MEDVSKISEKNAETAEKAGNAHRPLVSFLIPICRTPCSFLREMLESILVVAEKYGNYEILLHDDGSEDAGITAFLAEYAGRYPDRVKTTAVSPNCGVYLARQILVERAKGEYLLSFDSDDIMVDFDLAAEVEHMEAHPDVGATYSLKYFFDGDRRIFKWGAMPFSPFMSAFCMTAVPNAALFRADAVRRCGGYSNIRKGLGDDVILFSRLGEWYRSELRPAPRVLARIHTGNWCSKISFADGQEYAQELVKYLARRPYETYLLEHRKIPTWMKDYQLLSLAGAIMYVRQFQGGLNMDFLGFYAERYLQDIGLQQLYLVQLLKLRQFQQFEQHWAKLDHYGSSFPQADLIWLAQVAFVARQCGYRQKRLEAIADAFQQYNNAVIMPVGEQCMRKWLQDNGKTAPGPAQA